MVCPLASGQEKIVKINRRERYDRVFNREPVTVNAYLKRPYERVFVLERGGGFSCWVEELPGCVSQGETLAEAYDNLEEAMASWIDAVLDAGEKVPPTRRSQRKR